jgi:hypothetical protein
MKPLTYMVLVANREEVALIMQALVVLGRYYPHKRAACYAMLLVLWHEMDIAVVDQYALWGNLLEN